MDAGSPQRLLERVPLLDVSRQNEPLREQIDRATAAVIASGRFVLGEEVQRLEASVAEYCHTAHGVGCASGSDAVLLALMALDVGPGDEVIVPSYTFFATASAVTRLGATPVFADCDPVDFNLTVAEVERLLTPATKAVIPVHLFGQCADLPAIAAACERAGVAVVEDAAQAIGAELHGARAGSMSRCGCFSFYPTKNLGGFGDGGMLVTDDADFAAQLQLLRGHGMQPRYYHAVVGINSRLDSLQAAVLLIKLGRLEAWHEQRRENARRYADLFAEAGLLDRVALPREVPGRRHIWNQYVVRVAKELRDPLRQSLADQGVGTEIYYPVPLHEQACFAEHRPRSGELPVSEQLARETIALPIFPGMTADEQYTVVARLERALRRDAQAA